MIVLPRWLRIVQVSIVALLVGALGVAAAQSASYFRAAKKKKRPYAIQASAGPTKPVFDVRNAAPGDSGTSKVTLTNVGTKPARVEVRRRVTAQSELDPYLSISLYDAKTRNCIYPRPPKAKPIKRKHKVLKPKPTGPCKTLASWSGLPARFDLPPINKTRYVIRGAKAKQWKRREKHALVMTWSIAASAPNAAAGKTSSFTLTWRVRKR